MCLEEKNKPKTVADRVCFPKGIFFRIAVVCDFKITENLTNTIKFILEHLICILPSWWVKTTVKSCQRYGQLFSFVTVAWDPDGQPSGQQRTDRALVLMRDHAQCSAPPDTVPVAIYIALGSSSVHSTKPWEPLSIPGVVTTQEGFIWRGKNLGWTSVQFGSAKTSPVQHLSVITRAHPSLP